MNIEKIRQWIWFIIEAIIFIAIIVCVYSCLSNKLDVSEQNLLAAQGKIEQVELKNGELLTARDSYIATINDLENLVDINLFLRQTNIYARKTSLQSIGI